MNAMRAARVILAGPAPAAALQAAEALAKHGWEIIVVDNARYAQSLRRRGVACSEPAQVVFCPRDDSPSDPWPNGGAAAPRGPSEPLTTHGTLRCFQGSSECVALELLVGSCRALVLAGVDESCASCTLVVHSLVRAAAARFVSQSPLVAVAATADDIAWLFDHISVAGNAVDAASPTFLVPFERRRVLAASAMKVGVVRQRLQGHCPWPCAPP